MKEGSQYITLLDRDTAIMGHNDSVFKIPLVTPNIEGRNLATLNYAWLEQGMVLDPHTHEDGTEFFMFTSGTGSMMIGRDWFAIEANQVVTIPQGMIHSLKNDSENPLVFFTVRTVNKES